MEFMTCVVAAEEDELFEVAESAAPLNDWSGIDAPGLDTVKLATLHALLTGESLQTALDRYEPALVAGGNEEILVLRVADEMLEALAQLDEDSIDRLADELAATEIYEDEGTDPEDLQSLLISFGELAQLAESQGQVLYVRIAIVLEQDE